MTPLTDADQDNLARMPICTIDLGFSEGEASLGLAIKCGDSLWKQAMLFGEGIDRVNDLFARIASERAAACVLIVEAPLSMALTSRRDPCHRHFELQRNYVAGRAPRSPKGWYYQAGANLSLGSTIFLRSLKVPSNLRVLLAEGFYCAASRNEPRIPHEDVAEHLLKRLLQQQQLQLVNPRPEVADGTVCLLPGLEGIVNGIPGVLLRDGLELSQP